MYEAVAGRKKSLAWAQYHILSTGKKPYPKPTRGACEHQQQLLIANRARLQEHLLRHSDANIGNIGGRRGRPI